MRPVRVLVTNWESAENLGDYAILKTQVQLLEQHYGATVCVLGNQPGVVLPRDLEGRHCGNAPWASPSRGGMASWIRGLVCCLLVLARPSLSRFLPDTYRSLVSVLAQVDIVMPKGGGYLMADGSLRRALFLARTAYPLFLARRLGIRRVLWGHSIGPVKGRISRALLRTALQDARIVVRDDDSLRLCLGLRLTADRAPDLALLTAHDFFSKPFAQSGEEGVRRIGVTAKRVSANEGIQQLYLQAMAEAIAFIGSAAWDRGHKVAIHLVPQVTGPTPSEDDRPVLKELAALIRSENCVVEPPPRDLAAAMETYAGFDFVLATRLHSAILSACVGTPSAVFGYVGGKAQGMVQDLGLPEWTTTNRFEEIPVTALRCYRNRDMLRVRIALGLLGVRDRLRSLSLS